MEPKKNPKADLRKRSLLFFQIGLIAVLLISWRAIEHKSYEKDLAVDTLELDDLDDEDIPCLLYTSPSPRDS